MSQKLRWLLLGLSFLVFTATAFAQGECWGCLDLENQGAMCAYGEGEGYLNCKTIGPISCPNGRCCEPGYTGRCYICFLFGEYQYCVVGEEKGPAGKDNVQWRMPSPDTIKLVPWIADESVPSAVAKHSAVLHIDQFIQHYQMMELKNGINAPMISVFHKPGSPDMERVVSLSSVELYNQKGQVEVRQYIRISDVKVDDVKKGSGHHIKDVVEGLIGTKVEELELRRDGWTLTSEKGKFEGKIDPYITPMTKEQAAAACAKAKAAKKS